MRRIAIYKLLLLTIGLGAPLQTTAADAPVAAEADSLEIALSIANRGEGCVEAFNLATRQLPKNSSHLDDQMVTAEVYRTLANIALVGGNSGTSIIFSEAGLTLATEIWGVDSPILGSYELIHALVLRLSGLPNSKELAVELVDKAIERLDTDDNLTPSTLADLEQARANFTRAKGNFPLAITQYEAAIKTRLQNSPEHSYAVVDNEVWLAHAVLNSGDRERARVLFEHCRQDLLDLGLADHHLMASTITTLATISNLAGDAATAALLYRDGYARLNRAQKSIFPGYSQRRLESPVLNLITSLALEQGDDHKAWLTYSESHSNDGQQTQALKKARELQPEFANEVHVAVTAAANMTEELNVALHELRKGESSLQNRNRQLLTINNYARAMSESFRMRNLLRLRYGQSKGSAFTLDQMYSRLEDDQAFLGYFAAYVPDPLRPNARVLTINSVVVRNNGPAKWTVIQPADAKIAARNKAMVATYTDLIDKASEWPTRLPNDAKVTQLLRQLHDRYFAPNLPHLAGCKEIFLLSNELPSAFSFPAMIGTSGQSLIDQFVFQDVKGVADVGRTMPADSAEKAISLVLGDPNYDKNEINDNEDPNLKTALSTYSYTVLPRSLVDGVLNDGESGLARLPRLRSSGWEARGIASMTEPVVLLTGDEATEQRLYQYCGGSQPQSFKWIHLATHALVHQFIPEKSALALSPTEGQGLLFVEEIGFGWALNCELITLSGCQTGRGPGSWSSGQLGFIQALQTAGARHLLLSTAKVDDISTALLMERFYANISNQSSPRVEPAENAPLPYSFALADAQRWIRDLTNETGDRPFEHPAYWANFKLFGSGPR